MVCNFHFHLCRDNIPTITLGEWPLEAEYIEDDVLSGIKPILFADDPKVSEAAILQTRRRRSRISTTSTEAFLYRKP
jgi:hypothetical protein